MPGSPITAATPAECEESCYLRPACLAFTFTGVNGALRQLCPHLRFQLVRQPLQPGRLDAWTRYVRVQRGLSPEARLSGVALASMVSRGPRCADVTSYGVAYSAASFAGPNVWLLHCSITWHAPSQVPLLIHPTSFDQWNVDCTHLSGAGAQCLSKKVRIVTLLIAHAGCYLKSAASNFNANANSAWTTGARLGEPLLLMLAECYRLSSQHSVHVHMRVLGKGYYIHRKLSFYPTIGGTNVRASHSCLLSSCEWLDLRQGT